jgi:hypothetical protein
VVLVITAARVVLLGVIGFGLVTGVAVLVGPVPSFRPALEWIFWGG